MTGARLTDELVLDLLKARASGRTPAAIARAFGVTTQYVSTATNRVMRADLAESGEPRDVVAGAYW